VRPGPHRLPHLRLKEAGFDAWPPDLDGMLKAAQALAAKGKPGGLALGKRRR
jgi:hypothetical protein